MCAGRHDREAEVRPLLHGDAPEIGGRERRGIGRVSTLVEWDDHIPELEVVLAEAERARAAEAEVLGADAVSA